MVACEAFGQQLDRDVATDARIVRSIHLAHSSATEQSPHLVRTNHGAHRDRSMVLGQGSGRRFDRGHLDKARRRIMRGEQRHHLLAQRRVVAARLRDARRALLHRARQHLVIQLADPAVALRRHRPASPVQLTIEPCLGDAPVAPNRRDRDVEDVCRFLVTESPEEPQLHDAAVPRVQSLANAFNASSSATRSAGRPVGASAASDSDTCKGARAAPLGSPLNACEVDEDATHDLCRNAEEMRAVLPLHLLPVDQAEIGLVDESGRLQYVPGTLAGHVGGGQPVELPFYERRQRVQRLVVAVASRRQAAQ